MFKIFNFFKSIEVLLIIITAFLLIYNLTIILISLIEILSTLGLDINLLSQMEKDILILPKESSNTPMNGESHATNVQIIHNDGGWSNSIRSIFIYGTGVLRLSLLKSGGSPTSRAFVIGSTLAAEAASKVLQNAINDPKYVKSHSLWEEN